MYAIHLYRNFLSDQIQFALEIQYIEIPDFIKEREINTINLLNDTHDYSWLELLK